MGKPLSPMVFCVFRLSVFLSFVFTVVFFVGYASKEWFIVSDTVHYGLWEICDGNSAVGCTHVDNVLSPEGGYKKNSLAFGLMSKGYVLHAIETIRAARTCCLVSLIAAMVATSGGVYLSFRSPTHLATLVNSGILLMAGILSSSGTVAYYATMPDSVERAWGAEITLAGGSGLLAAGLLSALPISLSMLLLRD